MTEPSATITLQQLKRAVRQHLSPLYGDREAAAMASLIFHALKGWDNTAQVAHFDAPMSRYIIDKTGEILTRLDRHEPLQYILGEAWFYGMSFHVDPSVLIPRPETAELVDLIVDANRQADLRVLDVGTGSGAIAIALARNLPFCQVTAVDISQQALQVARDNADRLKVSRSISFLHEDIFNWQPAPQSLDIIVSNPPYIAEKEKKEMDANVLHYEPSTALFVPDDDPLRFYRRIAAVAADALMPGGKMYFEINPLFAPQMQSMISGLGFTELELHRDISRKLRFLTCVNPGK